MADIFEIVGKVSLDGLDKAEKDLKGFSNEGEKSSSKLSKLGGIAKTVGKGLLVGTGAVVTGAVGLVKQVSSSYGQLQQSIGGIETLFGDSAQKVIENANNAYTTAGISANEYMQQVTSFSASLLQSLGGDTEKAANAADMAVRDMADNANKMGTSMEMIQNAYQGFAKQNYTMLDNLKLGYGGTKTEMERLLADASKITGIKYDISNLNDVYSAIHVIQGELGITGTTALEAGETIEGSFNSLSASWQNFLAGLGNPDADMAKIVDNLAKGLSGAINNVIPVINNMVSVLPTVMDAIIGAVNDLAPTFIETFTTLITQVIDGIVKLLPTIIPLIVSTLQSVINTLVSNLPLIINAVILLVTEVINALSNMLPGLLPTIVRAIIDIANSLIENLPILLNAILQLVLGIANALPQTLPVIINALPQIISGIIQFIIGAFPQIITTVMSCLGNLLSQIGTWIGTLLGKVGSFFSNLISTGATKTSEFVTKIVDFIKQLPEKFAYWLGFVMGKVAIFVVDFPAKAKQAGSNFVNNIVNFIKNLPSNVATWLTNTITKVITFVTNMGTKAKEAGTTFINTIVNTLKSLPSKMVNIGRNVVEGLWNGIINSAKWLKDKVTGFCSNIIEGFKKGFDSHSPARKLMPIGNWITQGLGVGITEDDSAEKSIKSKVDSILGIANNTDAKINIGTNIDDIVTESPMQKYQVAFDAQFSSLNDGFDRLIALIGQYLPNIADNMNRPLTVDGKALAVGISRNMDAQLGKISVAKGRGNV